MTDSSWYTADPSWYDYFTDDPCNPRCDTAFVEAKEGVCLYGDWKPFIPYFDTIESPPDVVALKGSSCSALSQEYLDYVIHGVEDPAYEDPYPKDCYCNLCEVGKCKFYWGSTRNCFPANEIKIAKVMNLDDPEYKHLTDEAGSKVHSNKHQEGGHHGSGLIERENSISSTSNLSDITLFWLLVSIFTFVFLVVGLLSCETIRRLWNRRQRLAYLASQRQNTASYRPSDDPQFMGNQDDALDSMELTPILIDRPICTPFHLRK